MRINAATLAVLAGYIATTSCVPVPEAPTLETRSPAKPEAKAEIVAPLDNWHDEYERGVEARSSPKPEDGDEVIANKPVEAEGLNKRMPPRCTFWEQQKGLC